jgi:hypothetical protein
MHSDDLFENFFALYLVTGMRKRELLEFSNIKKSQKNNYIVIDKVLKKRDTEFATNNERPCLYDIDFVIRKFYECREQLNKLCRDNDIQLLDADHNVNKKIRNFFEKLVIQNSYIITNIHDCRKIYANLAHYLFARHTNLQLFIQQVLNYNSASISSTFHYSQYQIYDDTREITELRHKMQMLEMQLSTNAKKKAHRGFPRRKKIRIYNNQSHSSQLKKIY